MTGDCIKNDILSCRGQSLLEVIVAMAIFSLIGAVLATFVVGGFTALEQGGEQTQAQALATEAIEVVKSIREGAFNELIYSQSGVATSSNQWVFSGEGTTDTIGQFTRTIAFSDVCRDGSDDIATCPASYVDVHTKQVTATVTWEVRPGVNNTVVQIAYITNWDSTDWTQTDWSGGSGQSIWSDITQYDSDDSNIENSTSGQITLSSSSGGGCGTKTWPFTTDSNYTYNASDIEVTSGQAQLLASGGGLASGNTTNSDVDANFTGWTYNDWDQGGGEVDVTGTWHASSGNPTGWLDVDIPSGRRDELGGYWVQSFDTTVDGPTATVNFDWLVNDYDPNPETLQLYVFVDSGSGSPIVGQEVWSSGEITSVSSWASVGPVDVSSKLPTSGTYYVKIAVWVETPSSNTGSFVIGYDNIILNWSESSSYPTDEPSINPVVVHDATSVDNWTSFSETATKNGGEIYYQLSDDGSTWQYWNGSSWTTAGASNYNIATDVNTNISSFATTTGQIMFKAHLESDGTQLVQLDEISISCEQYYNWPFTTSSNYTYNSSDIEIVSGLAQLVGSGGGGITGIENSTIDSFEFDNSNGREVDFIHISGDIYATAYQGSGDDGFISTMEIDTSGNITGAVIDTLEYNTSFGGYPDIVHISGDIFAISYQGPGNDGWLTTVEIDSSGNITNSVVDSLEFNNSSASYPDIVSVSGDYYAISYQGPGNDGWLTTVEIDNSGNITNSVVDSWEYDTSNGREPSMINVSGSVFAIVSRGGGSDGFIDTVSISASGVITSSIVDTLEYDTAYGGFPDIINISGDIFAIVYRGNGDDGWLKTIDINTSGDIANSVIDSLEFDTSDGRYAEIINATGDYYLVSYRGVGSDGFISLIDIDNSGAIGSVIDSLEFDTSAGNYPNVLPLAGNFFAIAYQGSGSDGWVTTVELSVAGSTYPTTSPPINPTTSYSATGLDTWTSFVETATKNGGEIYYQLSSNDGSTWQYWNGSSWTGAGATNYNIATDVNTNISSFATTTGQIMFKAHLESDGTQLVQLDSVRVGWGEVVGGSGYASSGYLVSSAYDMGNISPVQVIEWDETLVSGSDIQLQLRTAPDVAGSPGTWTSWYGEAGAGTYFNNSTSTLVSTDLNGNQWVQYRVELTGDTTDTPVLSEVRVNYK
jgi:hypothetical protein